MPPAPYPANEAARLAALHELGILDTPPDAEFDAITRAAALACGAPISVISLVAEHRQWFKAQMGGSDVRETPRDVAFCAYTILEQELLEVPDARADPRFSDNPLVLGTPDIRFYAGMPLRLDDGSRVGTLCVIDQKPSRLDDRQRGILRSLAEAAEHALRSWSVRQKSKQVEQTLLQQQQRMAYLITATGIGTWEWNVRTGELRINERWAEILGWTTAELQPISIETRNRMVHPDDLPGSFEGLQRHFNGLTESYEHEVRMRHRNGSWVWVWSRGRVMLRGADGAPEWMFGLFKDVSERVRLDYEREARASAVRVANVELESHLTRARDAADRANRAKSRFLAGMSHELRTPLNGILGYAQLLRLEGGLNPLQSGRVEAMLSAGTHLLDMISSVLDLSEIEAEHFELRPVACDLRKIASASLDLVRPAAAAKRLELRVTAGADIPGSLMADPTRLRQVLLNLLGNAVKFTERGTVELRLRQGTEPGTIRFEVADTGPGIAPGERRRLFREFERLRTDVAGSEEGAGLGLALSSRLAALMGGRLGFEDNPGGGSVFWLELPLDTTPARPAELSGNAGEDQATAASQRTHALRVLVVDDVAMNRDIASAFLRAGGHEPNCAGSGAEAVAAAVADEIDVILMDVRMPDMDGLEATRRIRSLGGARGRVPIIGLTAQAFSEQVRACTEAGMDGHLPKPYTPQALLEIVAKTASRQASTGAVLGSVPTAQDGPGIADRPVDDDVRRPNQPLLRARELSGTAAAGERHQAIAYE